ncbi:aldo/keto reductase [Limosilactobacillus kribbianus]|uniref:aldo/keto reductase n=1 Tax=Limosilactobacillus kribbianus TaxID=2982695 RepID=UPI0022656707|nr:aldo/keto reductase [Limosilactobacillus kribbianus]
MKQVNLGATTLKIPAMALGIMRMEAKTPAEAAQAIDTAYDNGINFIDSADIYGQGKSEEVFGQALKQAKPNRSDLFIQSKVGIIIDPARSHGSFVFGSRYEFTKEHILDAVDGVLSRMGTDYLDSLLLHRPDPLMDLDGIEEAFDLLQASGKVRFFGVSNFNPQQFELVQSHVSQHLMFNQLQFGLMHTGMVDRGIHTNMLDADSVDHDGGLLEFSRQHHVTIQTWSPFQYGNFEGTFINNPDYPELNQALQKLADQYGVGKNAIAAAWILKHPAQMQMIIGTMNPAHIADSAKGADVKLTNQEWYDLYLAAGHKLP